MAVARPVGRAAASRKYDILTALSAFALAGEPTQQRRVLRLIALITARYNWQRDELATGQREIARLWSVDERTVKREMARLRAQGWLVQKRKGARGRVSVYGLDLGRILDDTRPAWPLVGPDFVERLQPDGTETSAGNVVPLRRGAAIEAPAGDGTVWGQVQQALHGEDPSVYAAWFSALTFVDAGEGILTLAAPSAFHATYVSTHLLGRLSDVVRRLDPAIAQVRIID